MPLTVIKIGGALVANRSALAPLWQAVAGWEAPVVLVHGGGPQATAMARRLGHEPRMVHGRRVTTDLDLDIVRWTMRGWLNTELVAQASAAGLCPVGVCGADGGLLRVTRRPPWMVDGERVDFGHVGDIERVDATLLRTLLGEGFLPVVAPLGSDGAGGLYNVNADTVAAAVAQALGAERFLLVAESGGVRRDAADASSHLSTLDRPAFEAGLEEGWIAGGMRVKLTVGFGARAAGIPEVYVLAPDQLGDVSRGTRLL